MEGLGITTNYRHAGRMKYLFIPLDSFSFFAQVNADIDGYNLQDVQVTEEQYDGVLAVFLHGHRHFHLEWVFRDELAHALILLALVRVLSRADTATLVVAASFLFTCKGKVSVINSGQILF